MALSMTSDVSAHMISNYENAKVADPAAEKVEAIAEALGFPVAFFYRDEAPAISPKGVSFRSLSRTPAKQRDFVRALAMAAVEVDEWIDRAFSRPDPAVPEIEGDPATVAGALRATWGLGTHPVGNMIHLLERHGVRVYGFRSDAETGFDPRNVNAVSTWHKDAPFIFLNDGGTAERRRFTLAHELGHLVMHRHGALGGRAAEREADAFAGAFLIPSEDLRAHPPRRNLDSIIRAKSRWKVAAIALVYRMHEDSLLSDWEYKQLCIRIRGMYGCEEPNEGVRETSQVLGKVLAILRAEGYPRQRIATELSLDPALLDLLLAPITILSVPGGGSDRSGPPPRLRLED